MRRSALALATAVCLGITLLAGPAHASTSAVLTSGSLGGPAIATGSVLNASIVPGTPALFSVNPNSGITCSSAGFDATVSNNPAAGGVATLSVANHSFAGCTTNLPGLGSLQSIVPMTQPYGMFINGTTKDVTFTNNAGFSIRFISSLVITCVYVVSSVTTTISNAGSIISVTTTLTKISGPSICPATLTHTVRYRLFFFSAPIFVQ